MPTDHLLSLFPAYIHTLRLITLRGAFISPHLSGIVSDNTRESRDENVERGILTISSATQPEQDDPKGFTYLKRYLIRLLGILAYRSKAIQDRVPLREGTPAIPKMCVIDERNSSPFSFSRPFLFPILNHIFHHSPALSAEVIAFLVPSATLQALLYSSYPCRRPLLPSMPLTLFLLTPHVHHINILLL